MELWAVARAWRVLCALGAVFVRPRGRRTLARIGKVTVDTSYYFVLEPDGVDDGPYRLHEIQRRVDVGLISRSASLCKAGETTYVPLVDPRFSEVLEPPRKPAAGTTPPPVVIDVAPIAPMPSAK